MQYLDNRTFFNILGEDFYTEEFFGPIACQLYLDIDTGKVVLEVYEQQLINDFEDKTYPGDIQQGYWVLKDATPNTAINPDTGEGGPGSWEMQQIEELPLKAVKVPRTAISKKRYITDDWVASW